MNDDQVASQMTVANAIATIPQAQSERSTNVCLLFFSRVTQCSMANGEEIFLI